MITCPIHRAIYAEETETVTQIYVVSNEMINEINKMEDIKP